LREDDDLRGSNRYVVGKLDDPVCGNVREKPEGILGGHE